MAWIFGISCYIALVWLLMKFFQFVARNDEEIERMKRGPK